MYCLHIAIILTLSSGVLSDKCLAENGEKVQNFPAYFVRTINLELSKGVDITWQAARGTTNISVWVTDDLTLSSDEISDGTLRLKALLPKASGAEEGAIVCMGLFLMSFVLYYATVDGQKKWSAVLILCLALMFGFGNTQNATNCKLGPTIHIQIPTNLVQKLCVNGECRHLLCPLSPFSEYSSIPSNNRIIFSDDQCSVKKPDFWDEWLIHFFGNGTTRSYLDDPDSDGFVNILEYYGPEAFEDNFVTIDTTKGDEGKGTDSGNGQQGNAATLSDTLDRGTSPLEYDSDGDLIPDGRERLYNTDPNVPDQIDTDDDNDGLNTLDEQIHNTDPKNADSDGDGTKDGEEVDQGSNPNNPRDQGKPRGEQDCDQKARIKITVGDHSGSHSERYVFHLGEDISHQSPGYGLVGSGEYTFEIGTYIGTLEHAGTNRDNGPDYDYTALLEHVGGDAKVTISDPDGMLGRHGESNPLYSNGKSVTVKVELDCPAGSQEPCCICAQLNTCKQCQEKEEPNCLWEVDKKTCVVKGWFDWFDADCPCDKCQEWYDEEKEDLDWKDRVNRELPCPCRVTVHDDEVVADQDNPSGRVPGPEWYTDSGCEAKGSPWCDTYHPGAYGCIRSTDGDNIGLSGQQCCYDSSGAVLGPPHPGAGTPDKVRGGAVGILFGHLGNDVYPYDWCCLQCEEPDTYCPLYRGVDGARGGDTSHCNK